MRAVLTNFGTVGDFVPLLTLARELAKKGHTPVLAFPPFARALAAKAAFEFVPIGPDLSSLRDQVNVSWTETQNIYESSEGMLALLMPFREAFDQIFVELKQACCNADVLVSGPAQPMARIVHEVTGLPFVSIQISHFGGSGGPAVREAGARLINPFRRKLGLPVVNDPLTAGANSPQLSIYAMSRHLRARPSEWPAHHHLVGFFFDRDDFIFQRNPQLEEFLTQGPPPVVMTLGSLAHRNPAAVAELLAEAARLAHCRAVIQAGVPAGAAFPDYAEIFWAGPVSHTWLFPRAACIVLHGGVGTAAAAFRAGVPTIFIPHGDVYDQRYWAQLAFEAGCSTAAIPYSDLTAEKLASAIQATLYNSQLRDAAMSLGSRIRAEPGVDLAANMIAEFVARIGLCLDYRDG